MTELVEQPAPKSVCPECGGDPLPDPTHNLSAIGYLHDDIQYTCSSCDNRWVHGVPIGEHKSAFAEKLFCKGCRQRYGIVHRVNFEYTEDEEPRRVSKVNLSIKCPNCNHYWVIPRGMKEHQVTVLVGNPSTTGSIESVDTAYAYNEDEI